ncbi:MAG: enoyl-CoA hydratase/isomerase family protein [Archangium sp.]|nr:enoyl-CoA hydratase/isomerase family protein [Archangium sp.]MDP3152869.1 enoyl-CoA hydratase/isomerase family protein [Archangium sp.]
MITTHVADGIASLELNRPEVRNAINKELCDAVTRTLDAWAGQDDVRVVVVSGAGGKAFAAGADIGELKERTHAQAFLAWTQKMLQLVEDFPRPTIAAIDGYALGGGLELALACDLRVASKSAKIGMPEVTLGIYPSAGGTWRLPRLVGLGRAKELIYTGRIVDAVEAAQWGLFESLVESDAKAEALRIARMIAGNAPLAVQVAKVSLNAAAKVNAAPMEWVGQGLLFDSPEKHARMSAFLEKKKKI